MLIAIRFHPKRYPRSARRRVLPLILTWLGLLAVLCGHTPVTTSATLRVDYDRSSIVAITHRAGLLRFLGHDHGILVTAWSADVTYDADNPHLSRVVITLPVQSLVIDTAEARRQAGLSVEGPDAADVQKMQQQLRSATVLDAKQYPKIRFETSGLSRKAEGEWALSGLLTIRGITHAVVIPLRLSRQQETLHITGHFTLQQTDYGMQPVSIMGVVKVANEVDIRFDIRLVKEQATPR